MLRGHGENSLLLICGASWAVGRVERHTFLYSVLTRPPRAVLQEGMAVPCRAQSPQ